MLPKRSRKKKVHKMVETSTQTDPNFIMDGTNLSFLAPVVVLEKLDLNRLNNRSVIHEEPEQELSSCYQHSNETTSNKTCSQVMTVPNNYSVFAQPINNNQKANSTLASAVGTRRRRRDTLAPFPKAKKASKAGPLCYKQKCLQNDEEDLNIPIMLGSSKSPRNLHTILERTLEHTPTQLLPQLDNQRVDGECGKDIGLQTNFTSIEVFDTNILNVDVPIMDRLEQEEEISINNQPENVRFKCGGVTTVISTKSQHSDDDEDDVEIEGESRKKYIKINAKTVHIHNHFYNNS